MAPEPNPMRVLVLKPPRMGTMCKMLLSAPLLQNQSLLLTRPPGIDTTLTQQGHKPHHMKEAIKNAKWIFAL